MLGDGYEQFVVREDGVLLDVAVAVNALEARRQPVGQCKVDCLVEVEAVVESRVVRAGEGDDKLVGALVACDNAHAVLLEPSRAHERDELEHEVWLLLEELRCGQRHRRLELLVVCARDAVPRLGVAKLVVVDAASGQRRPRGEESYLYV